MQVVGNFNNISDELRGLIPALEGVQVLQMLNGSPNQEEDHKAEMPFIYGKTQLPLSYSIKDPFTNRIANMAMALEWDAQAKRPERIKCYVVGQGETHFRGRVSFVAGNMDSEELFPFLWLSPYNEDSPCKDGSIQPLYRFLNAEKDAQSDNKKMETVRKSLDVIKTMTLEKAQQFVASINKNPKRSLEELRQEMYAFARTDYDNFLKRVEDPQTPQKAVLREAFEKNLLELNPITGDVKMQGNLITRLDITKDFKPLDALQSYLGAAANGKDIFEGLKKVLEGGEGQEEKNEGRQEVKDEVTEQEMSDIAGSKRGRPKKVLEEA